MRFHRSEEKLFKIKDSERTDSMRLRDLKCQKSEKGSSPFTGLALDVKE